MTLIDLQVIDFKQAAPFPPRHRFFAMKHKLMIRVAASSGLRTTVLPVSRSAVIVKGAVSLSVALIKLFNSSRCAKYYARIGRYICGCWLASLFTPIVMPSSIAGASIFPAGMFMGHNEREIRTFAAPLPLLYDYHANSFSLVLHFTDLIRSERKAACR